MAAFIVCSFVANMCTHQIYFRGAKITATNKYALLEASLIPPRWLCKYTFMHRGVLNQKSNTCMPRRNRYWNIQSSQKSTPLHIFLHLNGICQTLLQNKCKKNALEKLNPSPTVPKTSLVSTSRLYTFMRTSAFPSVLSCVFIKHQVGKVGRTRTDTL